MSNPALKNDCIDAYSIPLDGSGPSTVSGAMGKTVVLLAILAATGSYTYNLFVNNFSDKAIMLMMAGVIGAFVLSLFMILKKPVAQMPLLSICYAALEGLSIGGITAMYTSSFGDSVAINAVLATLITLCSMFFLYSARIIRCTEKFMATVCVATLGVAALYLVSFISSFFSPNIANFLFSGGSTALVVNIVICIIAALNFIIDFHFIEQAANAGLHKNFEWYGAFSLLITIVWVYIEFLKLFARRNSK